MGENAMVELPDMERVRSWFDNNKVEISSRIKMEMLPFTINEVRVIAEVIEPEEKQWILIMLFCMALRKGKV